jgi:hypothetical protein
MAQYFIESEEFSTTYGNLESVSDESYLTLIYQNVLDRNPDQDGFDFWSDQQENGLSRTDIMLYFSESPENVARVSPSIDDGIFYF